MKYVVFLFVLSFPLFALADDTLNLSFAKKIYAPAEEILLNLTLNTCSQQFKIRPTLDSGVVAIYNPTSFSWVDSNNSWDKFPYLDSNMKIRVSNVLNSKVTLVFEVQNTKLGEINKSKEFKIWVSDAYTNYIKLLNENIVLQTSESSNAKLTR